MNAGLPDVPEWLMALSLFACAVGVLAVLLLIFGFYED